MYDKNNYFVKKMLSNSTIKEVQNMISFGNTYKQIKEKTGVSDGTIARIKQGKIKANRFEENTSKLYTHEEVIELNKKHRLIIEELENELIVFRKRNIKLKNTNKQLENEKNLICKENVELKEEIKKLKNYDHINSAAEKENNVKKIGHLRKSNSF